MFAEAAAAIVAGGQGTRLGGVAKAFVEVGGRPIIERQLEVLRPLFAEVVIVASAPAPFARLGLRVLTDKFPGKGAPGGVHAALQGCGTPWVFCLACDMPFVEVRLIEFLAGRRGSSEAVVPLRDGFPEPLFAFYSAVLAPRFAQALAAGNPSLARLLDAAQTVRVAQAELELVDPGLRSLSNVNTPEDLSRARGR